MRPVYSGPERPRVLLIAEAANPEWTSVPLVGWSHAAALARVTHAHVVTQVRNRDAILRAGVDPVSHTFIDSEAVAKPLHRIASILRGGKGKGWTMVTAMQSLTYPYFEHLVWSAFKHRLRAGEFDVVHRVTPLSPTIPSFLACKLARLGVPFVLGPLNGGVPWPREFDAARRREREWLSYVRGIYRVLPGYRSTRRHSTAVLCGSRATLDQMPAWCRAKCLYMPENAVDLARFPEPGPKPPLGPLRIVFIGRLVPYKGADMLLEAAAPLIHDGSVEVEIIGDGPEMPALRRIVERHSLASGVRFAGWVEHASMHERLAHAHVLGFPSVREFGGGVVLEAMAQGLVPVVVDYGGPGELVTPSTGVRVPLGPRDSIIAGVRQALRELASDERRLRDMSKNARQRVVDEFTWDAKARRVLDVYRWVTGRAEKPVWSPPDEPGLATPAYEFSHG